MLISLSKKFVFVHVQKTAGTSIRAVLQEHAVTPRRSLLNKTLTRLRLRRDIRNFYLRPHASIRQIQGIIPAEELAQMFTFAFVRNPWDRLVSWYSFMVQTPDHRRHRLVTRLGSFEAFLRFEVKRDKSSQYRMLSGADGMLLVDFVGRFENLRNDFDIVLNRLGISAELPRTKVSKHAPYQSFYTPETAALVERHWHDDVSHFGYSFE